MSEITKIAWTDSTFNPWVGCEPVSPGCDNCYAAKTWARLGLKPRERRRTSLAYWRQALEWNKQVTEQRRRVFCGSLCDWLDDKVRVEWLAELMDLIRRTLNLDWLLLTKRIECWRDRLDIAHVYAAYHGWQDTADFIARWLNGNPPQNVWVGVTAENQDQWDKRVQWLMRIPARVHFVSVEPMLEKIIMQGWDGKLMRNWLVHNEGYPRVDWVIFGGESGPRARPCNVEWIRDGLRQCREANVPVFVKQLGSNATYFDGVKEPIHFDHPKGGDPDEWDKDLQVQEWPVSEWRVD